jgi:DNA-binding IclR family transcriptional regulator
MVGIVQPIIVRPINGHFEIVAGERRFIAAKAAGLSEISVNVATAGRSKGIRLILVTQRTQALHNALLGSCETMIAHRMSAPADQEPVVKWLKANTDKATTEKVANSLSSTPTGSGWLCSGEEKLFELVKFPRIHTYDNSATPTGDAAIGDVKTAAVDPERLRAIIGDAVKTAEANDPAALKKQIAELQRELKAKPVAAAEPDVREINVAHNRGFEEGREDIVDQLEVYYGSLEAWSKGMPRPPVFKLDAPPRAPTKVPHSAAPKPGLNPVKTRLLPAAKPPHRQSNGHAPASDLPKGEVAILSACIQYPEGLRREQLTVLTGFKRSTRDAYVYRLKEKGFVDVQGDTVTATEDGMLALPNAEPLPRGEELQQFWLNKLPQGERLILEQLIEVYPKGLARDEVTERTGFKRSTRDAYLYRMSSKQIVTEPSRGEVRASEDLFS